MRAFDGLAVRSRGWVLAVWAVLGCTAEERPVAAQEYPTVSRRQPAVEWMRRPPGGIELYLLPPRLLEIRLNDGHLWQGGAFDAEAVPEPRSNQGTEFPLFGIGAFGGLQVPHVSDSDVDSEDLQRMFEEHEALLAELRSLGGERPRPHVAPEGRAAGLQAHGEAQKAAPPPQSSRRYPLRAGAQVVRLTGPCSLLDVEAEVEARMGAARLCGPLLTPQGEPFSARSELRWDILPPRGRISGLVTVSRSGGSPTFHECVKKVAHGMRFDSPEPPNTVCSVHVRVTYTQVEAE